MLGGNLLGEREDGRRVIDVQEIELMPGFALVVWSRTSFRRPAMMTLFPSW